MNRYETMLKHLREHGTLKTKSGHEYIMFDGKKHYVRTYEGSIYFTIHK